MEASTIDKRILGYILHYVGVMDYASCSLVNKHWNQCLDNEFWRVRYYEEGGSTPNINTEINWKFNFYDLILTTGFISKLAFAFRKNDSRLASALLKKRSTVSPPLNLTEMNYIFIMAAAIGNVDVTRTLMKHLPEIRVDAKIERLKYSAIQIAVNHLNYDMVRYLLEELRVDPYSSTEIGHTTIFHLIKGTKICGFSRITERNQLEHFLIHPKWDVVRAQEKRQNNNSISNKQHNLKGYAHTFIPDTIYTNEIWCGGGLVKYQDIMIEIFNGNSPRHEKDPDLRIPMLELLLQHIDIRYSSQDNIAGNALHWSIEMEDKILTKWLLENFYPKANAIRDSLDEKNVLKRMLCDDSYLSCASKDMLVWLITEGGLDVNSVSSVSDCPIIHNFVDRMETDFVRKLITEHGAKVVCEGQKSEHILFHFNTNYDESFYLFLREHGARIDTQYWQQHLAHFTAFRNIDYMKRIIAEGYNMSYVDFIGRTVADKVQCYLELRPEDSNLISMNEFLTSIGAPRTDRAEREKKYGRSSMNFKYPRSSWEPMEMKNNPEFSYFTYYQTNEQVNAEQPTTASTAEKEPHKSHKDTEKCVCM